LSRKKKVSGVGYAAWERRTKKEKPSVGEFKKKQILGKRNGESFNNKSKTLPKMGVGKIPWRGKGISEMRKVPGKIDLMRG